MINGYHSGHDPLTPVVTPISTVNGPSQSGSFMPTPGDLRNPQRDPNTVNVGGANPSPVDPRQTPGATRVKNKKV